MKEPSSSQMRVMVAHPGTQHSYATALALQHAGMLDRYLTTFYYKVPSLFSSILHFLPSGLQNKFGRELMRRRVDALDQDRIQIYPLIELTRIAAIRAGQSDIAGRMIQWRNRSFDKKVARLVKKSAPNAVICYDTCAIETFRACKQTSTLGMLDQTTGYIKSAMRIMEEEEALHPEFTDSIRVNIPGWVVERCDEETAAADVVLAASEYVRTTLIENSVPAAKIELLPYGADTSRFSPPSVKREGDVFRILYVGGISQRKGIKYLLEAFKRLGLKNAELVLVGGIMGSGRALAAYADYFRHIAHVPHREIHEIYQQADVFVFPSLHEGSSIAILEAMASGLPVIATTNSGAIIRDGIDGYVVPIRNIEAIMEKILLLYQNPSLRGEIGRQARLSAQANSWQAYERRLSQMIRRLTAQVNK